MIVWHAVDRHVQLRNGNLTIEATTTLLFDFRTRVQLSWKNDGRERFSREYGLALAPIEKKKYQLRGVNKKKI